MDEPLRLSPTAGYVHWVPEHELCSLAHSALERGASLEEVAGLWGLSIDEIVLRLERMRMAWERNQQRAIASRQRDLRVLRGEEAAAPPAEARRHKVVSEVFDLLAGSFASSGVPRVDDARWLRARDGLIEEFVVPSRSSLLESPRFVLTVDVQIRGRKDGRKAGGIVYQITDGLGEPEAPLIRWSDGYQELRISRWNEHQGGSEAMAAVASGALWLAGIGEWMRTEGITPTALATARVELARAFARLGISQRD